MTEPVFLSAVDLAAGVARGDISSVDLTQRYIDRIERFDTNTNAVVVRRFEDALREAAAADEALAQGQPVGPLHGVPVTIKDSYDLVGTPTTWGIPAFANNIAQTDSHVVERLKAAGAHFLGKTNVPRELADFQSYNDIYGVTGNPWDVTRTPGGSSGGSAVAMSAAYSALEAGSDIGGSIRNPAHYCGVYGHKPTWGIVPTTGHALPGMVAPPDIAVCGPLARSPGDLALAMDLLAGPDHRAAHAWRLDLPRPRKTRLADYRVAIWPEAGFAPVATEISDKVQTVADALAQTGAQVSDTARPRFDAERALQTYFALLWGVMGAGAPNEVHAERKAQAQKLDPDDHSAGANLARYTVQDHRTWLKHDNYRFRMREAWSEFFDEWDILICPQMPTVAFPHDHAPWLERTIDINNRTFAYSDQLHWAGLITVAHLPSTVFPTGTGTSGLPIGLQAVGREYDDFMTIDFCRLLAEEIGGCEVPPGYAT